MKENQVLRKIASIFVPTIIATASASWAARGLLADAAATVAAHDRRISVLETQHEADVRVMAETMNDIRTQLGEIRTAVLAGKQ